MVGSPFAADAGTALTPNEAAAEIDRLVASELAEQEIVPASLADDETFLRRLALDVAGRYPTEGEIAAFALDPSDDRVGDRIDQLLDSDGYGDRWARYWTATIYSRATQTRAAAPNRRAFEGWLAEQFDAGRGWDEIVSNLITATGNTAENPATAFLFAHAGETAEIAGEASRVFMGIQISCAQCHDHPFDRWKRTDFHEFAAFFPRVQMVPRRDGVRISFEVRGMTRERTQPEPRQLFAFADRNRDGELEQSEMPGRLRQAFQYLSRVADRDQSGTLSLQEVLTAPPPPVRAGGAMEHEMPNLSDPTQPGEVVSPKLFATGDGLPLGTSDTERRLAAAAYLTSAENVWFARAVVNRYWNELLGEGFYVPVDDLGPDRAPVLPEVLDVLVDGFVASGYDLRWLVSTIAQTTAYRRQVSAENADYAVAATAGLMPSRKRGDQIYDSILAALGGRENRDARGPNPTEREFVSELFGPDPSIATADQPGTIPQALFLMNAKPLEQMLQADRRGGLSDLLKTAGGDREALSKIYLHVLGREPRTEEVSLMLRHVRSAGSRPEGFEDIVWSLLNSAEFLARR